MAAKKAGETEEQQGFEQALERLEEIVERMEHGDLALEEAMALFEEGVKLGQSCQKRLDEAERKITMLIERADGTLAEEGFDPSKAAQAEESAPRPRAAAKPAAAARKPAAAPALRQPAFGDSAEPEDIPF